MSIRGIVRLRPSIDQPTLNRLHGYLREQASGTHNFVVGTDEILLYLRDDKDLTNLRTAFPDAIEEVLSEVPPAVPAAAPDRSPIQPGERFVCRSTGDTWRVQSLRGPASVMVRVQRERSPYDHTIISARSLKDETAYMKQ